MTGLNTLYDFGGSAPMGWRATATNYTLCLQFHLDESSMFVKIAGQNRVFDDFEPVMSGQKKGMKCR
jgi:hypothetical protein